MSVAEELLPGSYKGVAFLIERSSVAGGRKDVKHSFPNSNKQTIEDLGLMPRIYTVEAILTTTSNGNFYMQRRDRLLSVLEEGGKGVLVHPFYGQIENVVARTFSVVENTTELGDSKLNIVFEISDDAGTPTTADNTLSLIESNTTVAINALSAYTAETFTVSTNAPTNYATAVNKLNDVVADFSVNITFLSVASDAIDTFSNELGDLEADITSIVSDPQAIADSITSLYNTVNGLYTTVDATFEVLRGFFDFGDTDIPINQTTTILTERQTNNDALNGIMQGQALCFAYLNAAQIDYQTVTEVDAAADILETQYQRVISSAISNDAKEPITDLRVQVQAFFDEQKLNVQQIISVNVPEIPARVLAYQYYGSSDLGADLAELNEDFNATFLDGEVEILTV